MAPELDVLIRARRAVVDGREAPVAVGIRAGRIASLTAYDDPSDARAVVELLDDEVLLPGLVDTHVHVNEPGRTEWEGFETATRAAAAGGVTTIVDMPLNSIPPTTTVPALEEKRAAARDRTWVDVGFWGGAVPGNLTDLSALHGAGVFGFKCFLLDSGVEEFPHLSTKEFADAMAETARLGTLMLVHAEDADLIDDCACPRQGLCRLPRLPPARGGGARHRRRHRRSAANRGPRPRRTPQRGRGDPGAARAPGRAGSTCRWRPARTT